MNCPKTIKIRIVSFGSVYLYVEHDGKPMLNHNFRSMPETDSLMGPIEDVLNSLGYITVERYLDMSLMIVEFNLATPVITDISQIKVDCDEVGTKAVQVVLDAFRASDTNTFQANRGFKRLCDDA